MAQFGCSAAGSSSNAIGCRSCVGARPIGGRNSRGSFLLSCYCATATRLSGRLFLLTTHVLCERTALGWASLSRVCRRRPKRLPDPAGFTKLSMTASASWRGAIVPASGLSPATAMTSLFAFRSLLRRYSPASAVIPDRRRSNRHQRRWPRRVRLYSPQTTRGCCGVCCFRSDRTRRRGSAPLVD